MSIDGIMRPRTIDAVDDVDFDNFANLLQHDRRRYLESLIKNDSSQNVLSTHFSDVYKLKNVERIVGADGKITPVLMDYLANEENPIDVKIAIVNALSYGKDNYKLFWWYLKDKYSAVPLSALLANLDASTLISLAYINVMDNYHDVDEAVVIAENARLKTKNSFTVNIINALIYAQMVMADDYCTVFKCAVQL